MFETPNGAHYRQERIEVADFFTNKHVDEMILQTEVGVLFRIQHLPVFHNSSCNGLRNSVFQVTCTYQTKLGICLCGF